MYTRHNGVYFHYLLIDQNLYKNASSPQVKSVFGGIK